MSNVVRKPLVFIEGNIDEAENTDLVESSVGLPNTTIGGIKSCTASWSQLTATAYTILSPVRIQADPLNTVNILVGFKNDPSAAGDPTEFLSLDAGAFSMLDQINEPRKIYVKQSVGSGDLLYWSGGI